MAQNAILPERVLWVRARRNTRHGDGRNIPYEADLVDQLFNSSEKRLARILLLLAHFGKEGKPENVVPKISQETLAEMVGTTRSRVSFFMNRFRKLGFIHYNGGLEVHTPACRSPRLASAPQSQGHSSIRQRWQIRHLLDLIPGESELRSSAHRGVSRSRK